MTSTYPSDSSTPMSPLVRADKEGKNAAKALCICKNQYSLQNQYNLQINTVAWEGLAKNQPTWKKDIKTGAAIYQINRITVGKAKGAGHDYQVPLTNNSTA